MKKIALLACLLTTFGLCPLALAKDPVDLESTMWTIQEQTKAKLQKLGKDTTGQEVVLLLGPFLLLVGDDLFPFEANEWVAIDVTHDYWYYGTFARKGKKGFELNPSSESRSLLEAIYADWIEGALADEGLSSDVAVDINSYRGKGKVKVSKKKGISLKYKVKVKLNAVALDLGESARGKVQTKAIGIYEGKIGEGQRQLSNGIIVREK